MLRVLRHYLPLRRALLFFSETLLLTVVLALAMSSHLLQPSPHVLRELANAGLGPGTAVRLSIFSSFLLAVLCQTAIAFNELYDFRVSGSRYDRASRFVASTGSAVAVSLTVVVLARIWNLQRVVAFPGLPTSQLVKTLVFALLFAFALLYLWRHLFHFVLRQWNFNDRVLILGAGPAAQSLAQEMIERADSGYEAVGLVPEASESDCDVVERGAELSTAADAAPRSDSPRRADERRSALPLGATALDPDTAAQVATLLLEPLPPPDEKAARVYGRGNDNGHGQRAGNGRGNGHGHTRAGAKSSLVDLVQALNVDLVVVALDDRRGHLPTDELLTCRLAGVAVQEREAIYERITGKIAVEAMRPSYLIFNEGFSRSGASNVAQRGVDLTLAGAGLLLAWPLMLATAIAIRLDSPGPVLFVQERVGRDGVPFRVFKFRSMRSDAEKLTGPVWATENDPRITRSGRFIRKTRLDELPQLFNVLFGDMSLVGPRPERGVFVAELADAIPYYEQRHIVKPGLTGWAQINYPYGNTVADALHKLQFDLFYIKHRSVLFDLSILFQTVRTVLLRKGT